MPEQYPNPIWDRKKWQTERDKAGVAKGACSKVSAGDELDKFKKEFDKGYEKYKSATERLVEKMGIYCASLDKSKKTEDKKWAARVRTQIVDHGSEMLMDFQKIEDARGEFKKGVKVAKAAWPSVRTEALLWLTNSDGSELKVPQMKVLIAGLQAIDTHGRRLRYVTDEVSKEIQVTARRAWYDIDGGKPVTVEWVTTTGQLITDLPVLT